MSLLPAGLLRVEGEFSAGDPVDLCDEKGHTVARGLVNYSADDARKIMGLKSEQIANTLGHRPYDEVVHRDNLALTA